MNLRRRWLFLAFLAATGSLAGSGLGTGVLAASAETAAAAPETLEGVPVGFTEQGYPYRGDPDAPIRLEEYSDYLCPFCGRHANRTLPALLEKYTDSGKLTYVFRDMPLASLHPTAAKGHEAALCVAEQGAVLFWAMHDELFRSQRQWSRLPDPSEFLAASAERIGADRAAYDECIAAGRKQSFVEQSIAAGQELGFNGTPSFQFVTNKSDESYTLVGAQPLQKFSDWLDALLAGEAPPQPKPPKPAELPYWAKPEGLAPDPERPGYTLAGDQYKGNPEAPLVMVEFADFQCPPCQRHALEVQPVLDQRFIDTGEVLWVFKHLPLKEHAQSATAAAAAECAAEQNRFWEMHHLLFEQQERWANATTDAALLALAEQLELDRERFATCFNGRQALERVLHDLYDAQGVVRTTPTFITIYNGKGSVMRGSLPAEQFVARLQARLAAAEKLAATNTGD